MKINAVKLPSHLEDNPKHTNSEIIAALARRKVNVNDNAIKYILATIYRVTNKPTLYCGYC